MKKEGKIAGKVARILNSRQLVINRGTEHGVEIGMQFAVLKPNKVDIPDPETGEVIGSIDVPKVIVKVVQADHKLAIASTFRTIAGTPPLISAMNTMSTLVSGTPERVETLRTDQATYKQEMDDSDSYVRVGDSIVEVQGDEFSGWGVG